MSKRYRYEVPVGHNSPAAIEVGDEHEFDTHTDICDVCHMPRNVALEFDSLGLCPGAPNVDAEESESTGAAGTSANATDTSLPGQQAGGGEATKDEPTDGDGADVSEADAAG